MTKPRRIKRGWMNLRVRHIALETWDTKTFYLEDVEDGGRPFDFNAGQYLTFRFDSLSDKPIVRSYTMSGSPRQSEETIFTVKRVEKGLVSNWLCDSVKVGDILRARGPIGRFCYDPQKDRKKLFMVAGGSGVTPFNSIIREYSDRLGEDDTPDELHLLVAFRTQKDLINWDVLEPASKLPGVNLSVTLTREKAGDFLAGRPDDSMIRNFLQNHNQEGTVMTCGPQAMMDLTTEIARSLNFALDQIKTESFES